MFIVGERSTVVVMFLSYLKIACSVVEEIASFVYSGAISFEDEKYVQL